MTKKEIFEAMTHNAKAMVSMGTAKGDMEMALVGHATLTALAAIQNGDGAEFSITMVAFNELMESKREKEREHAEMPEAMEDMLNQMGITTKG